MAHETACVAGGGYDVVVVGGGYAAFAAVMQLRTTGTGARVLLLDPWGDLVWESGRCFVPQAGVSDHPLWQQFTEDLRRRGGYDGRHMEGAMAEVCATCMLRGSGTRVLYYAHPVAVESDEQKRIRAVIVATRNGLRRITGGRYIDATEDGALFRLAGCWPVLAKPRSRRVHLYLHKPAWPAGLGGLTMLPTQRCVVGEVAGDETANQAVMRTIAGLDAASLEAVLSHASVQPYPVYGGCESGVTHQDNIAAAMPGCAGRAIITPADRFELGVRAASVVTGLQPANHGASRPDEPITLPRVVRELHTDVFVAGAGTGGALAAIAAAQQGVRVTCADPLDYPGGIGVGGGIYSYYYGVAGGLQETIDQQVRQLMKSHGQVLSAHPLNPTAKQSVLEEHFRKTGVRFMPRSFVFDVSHADGRVTSVTMITPDGLARISAKVFIDGTGDGDLCAAAGARFQIGRESDGLMHAYSQASIGISRQPDRVAVFSRNFDAGWCDPTDVADLTRARLTAIEQHQIDRATDQSRLIQLSPIIGIRQGRRIETDYVLTLDDQISARRFEDAVGYAGSNQDTHFVDFPMESDDTVFWLCLCRGWFTPMAHQISYRMLLPRGLKNVGIASRCLGVTQDAHYAMRMMRDMQRIGEAMGYAAATMARNDLHDLRDVPMAGLQAQLEASGALVNDVEQLRTPWARPLLATDAQTDERSQALQQLRLGCAGRPLWWLMKQRADVEAQVLGVMRESEHEQARWFAAGIAAKWGCSEAEPVLIDFIKRRSNGHDQQDDTHGRPRSTVMMRNMPNWLTAVTLLRMCGSDACLDAIDDLLASHTPSALTVLAVMTTLDRLWERGAVTDQAKVARIVGRIDPAAVTQQQVMPQAMLGVYADNALHRRAQPPASAAPWPACNTVQDRRGQVARMIRRMDAKLGLGFTAQLNRGGSAGDTGLDQPRAMMMHVNVRAASTPVQAV